MDVAISFYNNFINFDFLLDEFDEKLLENKVHLGNRSSFFELPYNLDENKIHPDLIGLSVILCVFPFVDRTINLPFSVSKVFSDTVYDALGIRVKPFSSNVSPRVVEGGRPGLAYSAGVDSTAALALMPSNTAVCFLNRVMPAFKKSLYDKSAALNTVKNLSDQGHEVYSIATNMEYLRTPVGFPFSQYEAHNDIPLSAAVPIILLADELKIDAVGFGIVLESVYFEALKYYDDFSLSEHFINLTKVFQSVSCDLFLPTAGLSEVATSKVTQMFGGSKYIRSCMRGTESSPCNKCIKCFRKLTLDQALLRDAADYNKLLANLQSKEVVKNLYSKIKHENVYRYIVQHLMPNDFSMALRKRVQLESEDTTWMERWYYKSTVFIPEKYLEDFKINLKKYIIPMNDSDIYFVEHWGFDFNSNFTAKGILEWQSFLKSNLNDPQVISFFDNLIKNQKLPIDKKNISFLEWSKNKIS